MTQIFHCLTDKYAHPFINVHVGRKYNKMDIPTEGISMARILTVDDEPLICRQIDRILSKYGHEVHQFYNGQEALEAMQKMEFDLALVDYHLPVMDGLEILHHLREKQPGCVRILVTGMLDLDLAVQAVNTGEVARFVEKPFKHDRLIAAVDDALNTKLRMVEIARVQEKASQEEEKRVLDECLQGKYIQVALQPLITSKGERKGEVYAFEALLRSTHKIFDGPLSIIRAAERYDRLSMMAEVIADRVRDWIKILSPNIKLFLNIHPDELSNGDALLIRLQKLAEWSDRIVLEITERSKLQQIESWEETLAQIETMGFEVAIDDLGAGYASLSVLADLRPKYIKMDMSIIRNIHKDDRKRRLVTLMCDFANATNAMIVAEGIEVQEELVALQECGVHLLQGFLFARPSLDTERISAIMNQAWSV